MSMRALRQLTEHADEQHREAMTTIHEDLAEAHLGTQDPVAVANRRTFVRNLTLGGAAVAFGAALVPAGRSDPGGHGPDGRRPPPPRHPRRRPRRSCAFARGLELAAEAAYGGMIATGQAARGQPLETARTFARHHGEHADALATLLPKATTNDTTPTTVAGGQRQDPRCCSPRGSPRRPTPNALMQIAFDLETGAASTYQLAMGTLENWQSAAHGRHHRADRGAARRGVGPGPRTSRPTSGCRPSRPPPPPSTRPSTPPAERDAPRSPRDEHQPRRGPSPAQRVGAGPRRGRPPLPRGPQAGLRPRTRWPSRRPRPRCWACPAAARS